MFVININKIALHVGIFSFCYVSLNIPLINGYETYQILYNSRLTGRLQLAHMLFARNANCIILRNINIYFH
jgi:hypothetical protein